MIFATETSCDETSCAVYDGKKLRSNVIFSQIEVHKSFGGVIPELASRSHLNKINIVAQQALDQAGVSLADIQVFGVTHKPGLPGSLLIGLCFTKALAWSLNKSIIGVNHLEGHIFSPFIEHKVPFPHLCLTASGGHTSLYLVEGFGDMKLIGKTIDDAAGEAFDKIAKLLGFPYPGGPQIEKHAAELKFQDFYFYPRSMQDADDFSFSGLKTAILYDLVDRKLYDMTTKQLTKACTLEEKNKVASSLLVCIKDIFLQKIRRALKKYPHCKAITFVGGVACNVYIRSALKNFAQEHGLLFFTPSPLLCTDNAGMIAFVTYFKSKQGAFADYYLDIHT